MSTIIVLNVWQHILTSLYLQYDVKNAFLHGDLYKEIYMKIDAGPGAKLAQHRDTRGELGKF